MRGVALLIAAASLLPLAAECFAPASRLPSIGRARALRRAL